MLKYAEIINIGILCDRQVMNSPVFKQVEEQSQDGTSSQVIVCETCKHETQIPAKGIPDLLQEYVLTDLIEMSDIEDTQIVCTSCKAKENAEARCQDCANFLCPNCVIAHQFMRCFENHKVSWKYFITPNWKNMALNLNINLQRLEGSLWNQEQKHSLFWMWYLQLVWMWLFIRATHSVHLVPLSFCLCWYQKWVDCHASAHSVRWVSSDKMFLHSVKKKQCTVQYYRIRKREHSFWVFRTLTYKYNSISFFVSFMIYVANPLLFIVKPVCHDTVFYRWLHLKRWRKETHQLYTDLFFALCIQQKIWRIIARPVR